MTTKSNHETNPTTVLKLAHLVVDALDVDVTSWEKVAALKTAITVIEEAATAQRNAVILQNIMDKTGPQ